MSWLTIYGAAVIVLSLIALFSRDRATRVLFFVIALEWLIYNAIVGDDRFALANAATVSTVAAAVTAISKWLDPTPITLTVVTLYAASMLLALVAALAGYTLERWYFEAINGMFALRLTIVGGWGVWRAVRHRGALGRVRDMVVPQSRATLANDQPL